MKKAAVDPNKASPLEDEKEKSGSRESKGEPKAAALDSFIDVPEIIPVEEPSVSSDANEILSEKEKDKRKVFVPTTVGTGVPPGKIKEDSVSNVAHDRPEIIPVEEPPSSSDHIQDNLSRGLSPNVPEIVPVEEPFFQPSSIRHVAPPNTLASETSFDGDIRPSAPHPPTEHDEGVFVPPTLANQADHFVIPYGHISPGAVHVEGTNSNLLNTQTSSREDNFNDEEEVLIQAVLVEDSEETEPTENRGTAIAPSTPLAEAVPLIKKRFNRRNILIFFIALAIIVGLTTSLVLVMNSGSSPKENPAINSEPSSISARTSNPSTSMSLRPTSSSRPSRSPSIGPNPMPSSEPTIFPSLIPSTMPSSKPSAIPSSMPSFKPSSEPSFKPSSMPSATPTLASCKMTWGQRQKELIEILKTLSDPVALSTDNTYQNRASKWLIEEDAFVSCPQDDKMVQRYAMATFFFSLAGPSSSLSTSWLNESHECTWDGLNCTNDWITDINLGGRGLEGNIPNEVAKLTTLRRLRINSNQITGHIPNKLGNLADIESILLHSNQLTGSIPTELGQIEPLKELDLSHNLLTGVIPSELGSLTNIGDIRLHSNSFDGPVPTEIGQIKSLQRLYFHNNRLTGAVPTELGSLTNIGDIRLHSNSFDGPVPTEIGQLKSLQRLYFHNNRLTGAVPTELGSLTNIEGIWIYNNRLNGSIPTEIAHLTSLQELDLSGNTLTGVIPSNIGNLPHIEGIWLYNNQLSGSLPTEIGRLGSLQILSLFENLLSGAIPSELGNLTNTEVIYLCSNQLNGSIPVELGRIESLLDLSLADNLITAAIPMDLGNLKIGLYSPDPLGRCKSGCSTDTDCSTGLRCFHPAGNDTVPGCAGLKGSNLDYCVDEWYIPLLESLALNPSDILGRCEGDCDSDIHCGVGLKCFHRSNFEDIPDCAGEGVEGWDYCIDEKYVTTAPSPVTSPQAYIELRSSINSNMCLDIDNASTDNFASLSLKNCTGNPNQKFYFDGSGKIRSQLNFDFCLEMDPNPSWGVFMHSACFDEWEILSDGSLRNIGDWKCMALESSLASHGTQIVREPCNSKPEQIWQGFLTSVGLNQSISLGRCEGNCNSDADCNTGLKCHHRSAYEDVSGCSGSGLEGWNYCGDKDYTPKPHTFASMQSKAYPVADSIIAGSNFANDNYGSSNDLLVKNEGQGGKVWKALLMFSGISSYTSARLQFYVTHVNTDATRIVRVSRYSNVDWKENTLTWNNFDISKVDKIGQTFEIKRRDAYKWKSVPVGDLLLEGETSLEQIVFVLEVISTHSSKSGFALGSKESGMAPRLIRGESCSTFL